MKDKAAKEKKASGEQSPRPKWWEIVSHGNRAWAVAAKREELEKAQEIAPLLAELKSVSGEPESELQPAVDNQSRLNFDLPKPEFDASDQLDYSSALKKIGLTESDLTEGDNERNLLKEINNLKSPAQKIDALNKKSVAPVGFNGGTAYNKFDPNNPIISSTDAVTQLARDRSANADEQEIRNEALQTYLENPDIDPLTAATIANKGSTFKPQRVKVRLRNGDNVYMDATPQIDGGFAYTRPNDEGGKPLLVPPTSTGAIEKDAELFERVLDMDKKAATRLSLSLRQHLKTAKPDEAWSKLVSEISKMQFNRYAKDPQRLYEKAAEIWSVKFPNRPIPNQDSLEQSFNPEASTEQASEEDQTLREDVRQRAADDGFEIIGEWVEGKGFLARDEQGRKGYFY